MCWQRCMEGQSTIYEWPGKTITGKEEKIRKQMAQVIFKKERKKSGLLQKSAFSTQLQRPQSKQSIWAALCVCGYIKKSTRILSVCICRISTVCVCVCALGRSSLGLMSVQTSGLDRLLSKASTCQKLPLCALACVWVCKLGHICVFSWYYWWSKRKTWRHRGAQSSAAVHSGFLCRNKSAVVGIWRDHFQQAVVWSAETQKGFNLSRFEWQQS